MEKNTSINVGQRLKAVRQASGYSQRALAKRAGVTNSTISGIEQNRVSPSVDNLKKVLDGIPISIIDFFAMDLDRPEKIFYSRDELVEMSDGTMSLRLVAAARKDRKLRLLHEIYPPQSGTEKKMMVHEGEEAGIIIHGRLEVIVGPESRVLSAGEAYYINTEIPHRFQNPFDEECELISAATPPSF